MASALTRKASLTMTTAGMPASSSCSPSATAEALQEPQSPTPTTTTSHSARSSSSISGGAGLTMLGFFRIRTFFTPCCDSSSSATSSTKSSALRLVLASRPRRSPERSPGRGARAVRPRASPAGPSVGSMMPSYTAVSLHPDARRDGRLDDENARTSRSMPTTTLPPGGTAERTPPGPLQPRVDGDVDPGLARALAGKELDGRLGVLQRQRVGVHLRDRRAPGLDDPDRLGVGRRVDPVGTDQGQRPVDDEVGVDLGLPATLQAGQ